jgi:hypothetical protein
MNTDEHRCEHLKGFGLIGVYPILSVAKRVLGVLVFSVVAFLKTYPNIGGLGSKKTKDLILIGVNRCSSVAKWAFRLSLALLEVS